MKEIFIAIRNFVRNRFNLDEDKAEEQEIVANIQREVAFKGANLWTLIFAILVASIGLNVNSTAVIIGAMLISPLMGPIMGVGLGVGTNDFQLIQRGVKNTAIASIISILTSALYFSVTPLHEANSELLSRTTPSLWDVFIAFFGGLAGIVAGTRKWQSNVIPGVAIATALMPPLCTAGFGLATSQWNYFFGAVYLFFINSLFICLATFLIVKHLGFHKKEFQTKSIENRVVRSIWLIVAITIIPSVFLAYRIVKRSIFENSAKTFVQKEFRFPRTQVVTRNYRMEPTKNSIELLVVGQELTPHVIDSLKKRMTVYGIDTNTALIVRQGLNAKQEIDIATIKASILEDVFKSQNETDTLFVVPQKIDLAIPDLKSELQNLYPELTSYSLSQAVVRDMNSPRLDTISVFVGEFRRPISRNDRLRLQNWLKERIKSDSVKLVVE